MIATTLAPINSLNLQNRKIQWIIRQPDSLKVKASDVDSYGDYDIEQIGEWLAKPAGLSTPPGTPDDSDEDLDKLYHLFLS